MAGQEKIKMPSANKATVDNKGRKFANKKNCSSSCVCLSAVVCEAPSPPTFLLSSPFFYHFVLFLTEVLSEHQGSCRGHCLTIAAFWNGSTHFRWRRAEHSVLCFLRVCTLEWLAQSCAGRKWYPRPRCKWWLLKLMTTLYVGVVKEYLYFHMFLWAYCVLTVFIILCTRPPFNLTLFFSPFLS